MEFPIEIYRFFSVLFNVFTSLIAMHLANKHIHTHSLSFSLSKYARLNENYYSRDVFHNFGQQNTNYLLIINRRSDETNDE